MSTAQNPTFTFPTETNGSNNGDGDGDGGGLGSRGANYFFGFLITFVVLLLIFIGCGIGSHRRIRARRNAMLAAAGAAGGGYAYEPWGPLSKDGSTFLNKPVLYERRVADAVVEDQWRYTMPLSATYRHGPPQVNNQEMIQGLYDHEVHPLHGHPLHHTVPVHVQHHQQHQHHDHRDHHDYGQRTFLQRMRDWIPGLSSTDSHTHTHSHSHQGHGHGHEHGHGHIGDGAAGAHNGNGNTDDVENEKIEPPLPSDYLDVAVLIAMPSPPVPVPVLQSRRQSRRALRSGTFGQDDSGVYRIGDIEEEDEDDVGGYAGGYVGDYNGDGDGYGDGDSDAVPSNLKEHPPVQLHIGTAALPWPAELVVFPPLNAPAPV